MEKSPLASDLQIPRSMKVWVQKSMKSLLKQTIAAVCVALVSVSCANKDGFSSAKTTETFVQDYNPSYLEVLWVIDDRSPMANYRDALVAEAKNFFSRLDASLGESGQYRMGIVSTDGRFRKGQLKPVNSPMVLKRGDGSLTERVNLFGNILFPLLNLSTDAFNKGFDASLTALTGTQFASDSRVPLVLVYLSYGDDQSATSDGSEAVEFYAQKLLALKNGKNDLIRVYSVNYEPLPVGTAPTPATRCALLNGNQIDVDPANYQDRYFRLANRLSGEKADLCRAGFSDALDLSGLRLKTLPKVFSLQGYPDVSTMTVTITDKSGAVVTGYPYSYDAANRQVVFTNTPPEGTSIVVTYLSTGN